MNSSRRPSVWTVLTYVLLAVFFVLILSTFLDYGINWDDEWQATYGECVLNWYASHFQDHSAVNYWVYKFQGGFFDFIGQAVTRISPVGIYETRHFLSAVFGLLGLLGVYQLATQLSSPLAGFLSTLFLLLTPRFYGHAFMNPKDVPFAVLYLFSTYYIVRVLDRLPKVPQSLAVRLGIVTGLALGIRIGGVILFGYLACGILLWAVASRMRADQRAKWTWMKSFVSRPILVSCLIVAVVAYGVMLLGWPAAQVSPILHPLKSLWKTTHFPWASDVFFDGQTLPAPQLPWYYSLKWILITLPEFYFLGLAAALAWLGIHVSRSKRFYEWSPFKGYCVLALSAILPLAVASSGKTLLYDGDRHLLFVIPPLAVISGVALARIFEKTTTLARVTALSAVSLSIGLTVFDMSRLHPYEYVYFNRIFGKGLEQAERRYETDYWGLSYKEGVEWVAKNYPGPPTGQKVKVASCGYPLSTKYFLPTDRFDYVGSYDYPAKLTGRPDVFLATKRWGCDQRVSGTLIHVVMREGAPLLYVKAIPKTSELTTPN